MGIPKLLKKLPIPTVLVGGLYSGFTGNIPLVGNAMEPILVEFDMWFFQNVKYPSVFLFFAGLMVAWIIYQVVVAGYLGQRKRARLKLVTLRDEGVPLRIRGGKLTTESEVAPWIKELKDWHLRVISAISKIDEADAGQYRTLDYPGAPRQHLRTYLNRDHRLFYILLDRWLVRLDNCMTKYGSVR